MTRLGKGESEIDVKKNVWAGRGNETNRVTRLTLIFNVQFTFAIEAKTCFEFWKKLIFLWDKMNSKMFCYEESFDIDWERAFENLVSLISNCFDTWIPIVSSLVMLQ